MAEQVSHHPPVSAFYAEHVKKKISVNSHIYTKSSFLGMSVSEIEGLIKQAFYQYFREKQTAKKLKGIFVQKLKVGEAFVINLWKN